MRKVFLIVISYFLLSSVLFAQEELPVADYGSVKEYEIAGITVTGTKYLDKEVLISISGLRRGSKVNLPGESFVEAIRNLWDQKLFTNVGIVANKFVGNQVFLEIQLEERPRLSRFKFKGIRNGDIEEIRKKINLTAGSILTENSKFAAEKIIKDYFRDKGFLNCSVNMVEQKDTVLVNSTMLTIFVDKGPKVSIQDIRFFGVNTFTESKLERQMKETKEKFKVDIAGALKWKNRQDPRKWSPLRLLNNLSPIHALEYLDRFVNPNFFKASKFDRNNFNKDLDKIIALYNDLGYRDARVVKDSVYQEDERNLIVNIYIEEGRQYFIREVLWKGNQKHSDSTLNYVFGLKKGAIYSQSDIDQKLFMSQTGNDVSTLYMDDGYLFFQVTPTEVLVEGDSIDLEMRVFEGAQAIINSVRISGNTKTNEHVIRRELRIIPGNKFSRSDLIRSQREIAQLGYFDPEQIEIIPYPNPQNGTVDVEFKVVEKPSDQLELSAGWGGQGRGIVGTAGVSFTNFSLRNIFKKRAWQPLPTGDGQRLSLRVQANGRSYQSYNFSFTEPWLGGKRPNSFTMSFFRTHLNTIDVNNKVSGYLRTTSASVQFGTRLKWPDDYFVFLPSINYQLYSLKNWTGTNFIFTDGYSHNLNLSLDISRNSIDQPIYPRKGALIQATASFTLPYSLLFPSRKNLNYEDPNLALGKRYEWLEYHKWKFKIDWYAPLSKNQKLVFRATAKMGFLFTYNDRIGLSPFERFEVGGDGISNVQFFGREIISLRGYDVFSPSTGAAIYNKYTMELRYPISLNPSATIFLLAFVEGGNFYPTIQKFNPINLRRSFGLGARIFLPMFGLLGFDYGIGFDNVPNAGNNIFLNMASSG